VPRRGSSGRWLERQRTDHYVRQRERHGYRSRAAWKLQELNRRDRLIGPGARVLDLGASPGGWTQVAAALAGPRGTVVAVDLADMAPVPGARFIAGDCRDEAVAAEVLGLFPPRGIDLVMSDMSPNLTGVAATDEAAIAALARVCLDYVDRGLKPGGALLMKLFQFADTQAILAEIGSRFGQVARRKPDASRAESREFYVVAKRYGI
jgi:23S rRNA (uridine2552-2'-O)-methyltransferase